MRSLLQRNMRDIKSMTQTLLKHPEENIIWLNWKKENWK
ncbi:putative lipo domain protein [Bacteroides fragilis str. DS-71]|nr:putative lipo domain protein [Bacteroides fragilis str. DS-71]